MNIYTLKIPISLLLIIGLYAPLWATEALYITPDKKAIHLQAIAHPNQFQDTHKKKSKMPGYHFLVWDQGKAASRALFTTTVSDSMLHNALIQMGAKPSNILQLDTWEKRNNRQHPAPDQRVTGTPITLEIQLPNQKSPQPLTSILANTNKKDFDFRFGGHLENQRKWHSGCGVCLYSCPGGKISNAAYTVRDYIQKNTQFHLKPNTPLKQGTPVTLIFRIKETVKPIEQK